LCSTWDWTLMLTTEGRMRAATVAKSGEPAGVGAGAAPTTWSRGAAGALGVIAWAADWQANRRALREASANERKCMAEFLRVGGRAREWLRGAGAPGCGARSKATSGA